MAIEVLYIPEVYLKEVIDIIELGVSERDYLNIPRTDVAKYLQKWCDEETEYLRRLEADE